MIYAIPWASSVHSNILYVCHFLTSKLETTSSISTNSGVIAWDPPLTFQLPECHNHRKQNLNCTIEKDTY